MALVEETKLLRDDSLKESRVVIIDEPASVALLQRVLGLAEFRSVKGFTDPTAALAACAEVRPDLVIFDIKTPGSDGFQALIRMRQTWGEAESLPILVFTADVSGVSRAKALSLGATDFLTKPGEATEITLRVRGLLEARRLQRQVANHHNQVERLVRARTRDLEGARLEALERLARAAEFRDDDTGLHTRRVGSVSAQLATRFDASEIDPALIELAAPLHDIGKIGIPDSVLLKPEKLTVDEFEVMKTHTTIGAKILGGSNSPVLKLAAAIALTHHERWDGTGYPLGLFGEEIPLAGRIVAVADVFDALTHERPYKRAWTQTAALTHIEELSGTHFDPLVVEAFLKLRRVALLVDAA